MMLTRAVRVSSKNDYLLAAGNRQRRRRGAAITLCIGNTY